MRGRFGLVHYFRIEAFMVEPTQSPAEPLRTLSPAPSLAQSVATGPTPGQKKPGTASARPASKNANYSTTPFWMGMGLSIAWVAVVAFVMTQAGSASTFAGTPLTSWAIGISAIISPVAMIWMIAAYLQRAADVQSVTEPLRRQLAMITGESGAAEVRIRRFNHAIKEQLDLLRSTKTIGDEELVAIMDRINEHKSDLENFEQHSLYQVKEIQDVIRRSMQHIEQLMEDKFAMLRILDNKLVQSGDDVARQTESIRDNVSTLLREVETNAMTVASAIERAMQDSKKLSDTARSQETSLLSAAETASSTLSTLSGKIDTDIAHFLGRAGMARDEAEKLTAALDTQTRSLDELSNFLPSRISEAEAVLRGVADRLYASEQMARDQAIQLTEKLDARLDDMQALLDRFTARVGEIDGGLQQRRSDLDGLVVRISAASNDLAEQLGGSIVNLGNRADDTMKKFAAANEEARRGTDDIASQLAETAARYEAATKHLSTVSEANAVQVRTITREISDQLTQFNALQQASQQAGQDVQARASVALQNLQQVLERLLSTRDATQSIGEVLTEKLRGAVEQNEHIIARINEAARTSVHALTVATESLSRKEGEITTHSKATEESLKSTLAQLQEQAKFSEDAMRQQNASLVTMLHDIEERLSATDKRLQSFADNAAVPVQQVIDQIDASTKQGSMAITGYGNDMQGQLERLQSFNNQISHMGQDVSRMTSETLSAIESLNVRFDASRQAQKDITDKAIEQFNGMADRLQSEVSTIGDRAAQAASMLKEAAIQVGQQTYQLQNEAKDSEAKINFVTTSLQNEAAAIRATLEKQSSEINDQLSKTGSRFVELSEALKDRTDAAYSLLDRVAEHYNEITRAATQDLEKRAGNLDLTASQATGRVQSLTTAMQTQISLIETGANLIDTNAQKIDITGTKTIEKLDALHGKFSHAHDLAVEGTNRVVSRMEDAVNAFKEQHQTLHSAAEDSVAVIDVAGTAFGEHASKLLDTTHQVENSIKSLSTTTASLAEQSAEIRTAMEQHNNRLLDSLKESVRQIDTTSDSFQKTTATAIMEADQATARYNAMAESASTRLQNVSQNLFKIADHTETTLGHLSAGITQQVGALNIVSEQIAQQQKTLTDANETQKAQLLDLYQKIGSAHEEASSVAERTIARLNETLQKVQDHLAQLGDNSHTALTNISTASAGFSDQAATLLSHAKQAEEQAQTAIKVTASLQEQAKQLRDALKEETTRTGDLLTDLLGRLTSGSDTMRDVGSTASMALSDLQMGIAQQVSALNSSMDQIATRQDTLTSSLETQRETLQSLATRLVTAQDDTANAAERAAVRITDGTMQIVRQIEAIENKATSTLETVQTTNTAFTKEASDLAASADNAAEHTQKLLDSAKAAQAQAADVCEKLRNETQETGATIGAVIDQVKFSATDLHKTTEKTETALSNLSSTITQQTTAITTNLDTISDKQTALGSALDLQREMLTGMVTRLTLAQDETAAMAERSAARLSDSAGQVTKQMEALGEQTQTALASVRAATTGLADEQATIAEHTAKAENQVRDMLKSTCSMHEEAKTHREAIKNESNQAIEHIRTVIAQLDATVSQMKTESGNLTNAMDKSALDFSTIAKNATDTLQRQADALSSTTSNAHTQVDGVNEKIRESLKLITEASDMSDTHGRRLMETAEKATTQLVGLISTMTDGERQGREALESASSSLTSTRVTLEKELRNIAELSARAVEQVMGAGSTLAIQSDALRANLASSESALTQAAELVREETSQIPTLLARSTKDIETTAKSFKTHTGEISETMLKTTDRCISTAGAIRDTMMEEASNMSRVVETADITLRQFNDAMRAQIDAIKTSTGSLGKEQKDLVEQATKTVAQLATAGDRLSQIRAETQQTATKLAHDFASIEAKAESTTQKLTGSGDNLTKQVAMLVAMTEKAEGKMVGASQSFREQLERVRAGVQTQIDDINRGLMQITAQLDRTGTSLRAAMAETVVDVEKIAGRFDQTSKETANQLTDRTARMRVATEEVARLLGGFGDQIDGLLGRLDKAGNSIKQHDSDLVGHMQQAFSHLGAVAERLGSTRALTENVTDAATTKLEEVTKMIEKQMRHLAEGGQTVTGIIQNVTQTYADQVSRVNGSVVESQQQIMAMNKSVEEMQQRTDRMRVTLKLQGDDLMNSLEQVLEQLSMAGGAMSDAANASLQEKALNSLKKIS